MGPNSNLGKVPESNNGIKPDDVKLPMQSQQVRGPGSVQGKAPMSRRMSISQAIRAAPARLLPGNLNKKERELFTDNTEISPWNAHIEYKDYKQMKKPTWKYLMGTMPDLHLFCQKYTVLLVFFGFWRSLGMWMGISNPFLGFCVFIASALDNWYNLLYMSWSVILFMGWSWMLGVPKELIYSGLYPVQGIFLGLWMYLSNSLDEQADVLLSQMLIMIPLQFFNLVVFQALCSFFVRMLNVTPMMISSCIVGYLYIWMKQKSTYFYLGAVPIQDTPGPQQAWFSENGTDVGYEMLYGMSSLMFSYNYWSALPLSIGLLVTSPIMFVTTWLGSVIAVGSAILLSPVWSDVSLKIYALQGAITLSSVSGTFFVLNVYSGIVGILAVFCTTYMAMGLSVLFDLIANHSLAISAYFVSISIYMTAGMFESLIPVELISMTVPEDHLRRYILSRKVVRDLKISKEFRTLDPTKFKNIESSLLPILLCSYAKLGYIKKIKDLLDLGADPNLRDYDGRCAIHIAACENHRDIVKLLLQYNADVNKTDNYYNTALSGALQASNHDLAKYLYKHGGRLHLSQDIIATRLCYMVKRDEYKKLKIWLECGADSDSSDYDKRTPLHIAYATDNSEIIKLLKQHCSSEQKADKWGNKPSDCQGVEVIQNKCFEFEQDKYDLGEENRDMTQWSKQSKETNLNMDPAIIEAVIKQIVRQDNEKLRDALLPSLLCEMIYCRNEGLMYDLLKENVNFNVGDHDNRTPLHIAASIGDLEVVKTLVLHGADVNAIDRFGFSPLLEACQNRHDGICEHLRSANAKLAMTHEDQVSLLCWSAYNSDYDMIMRLANNNIDLTLADYDNRNCLDIARDNNNTNLVELLEKFKS